MPRLTSVDAFRGIAIAAMLIVNNPGDPGQVYRPLGRAGWDGWAMRDLIFPFFLFIVGVSITLSHRVTWSQIVRRGVLIIALGLFLTGFPRFDLATWRIPGVLQRIGVCYLAAAGLYHATSGDRRRRGAILMSVGVFIWSSSYAVFSAGAAALALAAIYWAVEVRGWRGWTRPLVILGSNSVTVYAASVLLASTLGAVLVTDLDGAPAPFSRHVYVRYFEPLASPPNASLLYACAHLIVLFMLAAWMHRRRLFLRL